MTPHIIYTLTLAIHLRFKLVYWRKQTSSE